MPNSARSYGQVAAKLFLIVHVSSAGRMLSYQMTGAQCCLEQAIPSEFARLDSS